MKQAELTLKVDGSSQIMFCIKLYRIQWGGRSDSASVRGMNKKLNSTITPVLKVQRDPRNKSVPITSPFFNPLEPYHTDFPLYRRSI